MWGMKNVFGLDEEVAWIDQKLSNLDVGKLWGGHWEFQVSVATEYHSILFACTVNVLLSLCYGLTSI